VSTGATPAFAGKFRWQSTNGTGPRYYLTYTTVGGETALEMSATRSTAVGTLWTAYDAGGGAVVLVADNGLYLQVQPEDNLAILVPDAAAATAVTLANDPASGHSRMVVGALEACYQLDSADPPTLVFLPAPGTGALATFAQTDVTPSLAAIQSSHSAAGADLKHVNLTGAVLTGVDATGAHFDGATLTGVNLSGATLTGASFVGIDLTGVVWGGSINAQGAHFDGTIAAGVALPASGSARTTLGYATFVGADWSGCDLTGADLDNAVLTGADFSGATLENATLTGLQGGRSNDATVPGVDLSYAYLPDANLQQANLVGATLVHAQMYLNVTGVSLLDADLTETDLSGADLTGAQFGGRATAIKGTRFDDAILFQATFTGATLELSGGGFPVSMIGARLENATFSQTTLTGVQLSGAHVAVAVPTAGPGGAGVPLFVITSGVGDAVAALQRGSLPAAFVGVFAKAGHVLSGAATVTTVTPGTCWTLAQAATSARLGVEDVGYTVAVAGGTLAVAASGISLVEQADGGASFETPFSVTQTGLTQVALDPGTHCPNRATVAVNVARGRTWTEMMTAPRPALAALGAGATPPRPRHERGRAGPRVRT
jgi:uncharacterized protein YjbI with pentapeptide repeats